MKDVGREQGAKQFENIITVSAEGGGKTHGTPIQWLRSVERSERWIPSR